MSSTWNYTWKTQNRQISIYNSNNLVPKDRIPSNKVKQWNAIAHSIQFKNKSWI